MPNMMTLRKGIWSAKKSIALPARFKALAISEVGWYRCEDDPKTVGPTGWINIPTPPFANVLAIAYSGPLRRWIVMSYTTDQLAYSDNDGLTWTLITPGFAAYNAIFVPAHNLFYAITSTGAVYTSPNGITWTAKTALGFVANSIDFSPTLGSGQGRLVAVGGTSCKYSDNGGVTWTPATIPSGLAVGVTWSAKLGLFFIGSRSATAIASSPDGITWTTRLGAGSCNYVMTNERTGFSHAGPHTVGSNGARSNDGLTWTAGNMPSGLSVRNMWFRDRRVFYAGYYGQQTYWTTDDNTLGWTLGINVVGNWYAMGCTDQTYNPD